MKVRVLIDMDDGASGIRAVNVLESAMREYNEKLHRADPSAEIDFEVLGIDHAATPMWGTQDRRSALSEAERRWALNAQHDRITQRDRDLYGMGARQGFTLGAEWQKSQHVQ